MSGERIEAQFTLPASTSVSVANGGQTASQTVTPAATTYFLTAFLATLQQQLNDNVQGYPQSLELLHAALGFGNVRAATSSGGWLCNETSGNLIATIGATNLTPTSSPTYGTGPKGGIDKAIGFDSSADGFSGGDVFDVDASSDLVIVWVGKFSSAVATGAGAVLDKRTTTGYVLSGASTSDIFFNANSGSDFSVTAGTGAQLTGEWHAGIAVIDRGAGTMRVGTRGLVSGTAFVSSTTSVAGLGDTSSATTFDLGASAFATSAIGFNLAALYIATGTGVGSGISANLSTALSNFAAAINASWACSLSPTTGKVSLSYTSPPAGIPSWSWDWLSPTLRDVMGFAANINYPTTAAEVAAIVGGTWTHGWLFNESASPLVDSFGVNNLQTSFGSPLFGFAGARGGADKAVSHTDGAASIFSAVSSPSTHLDLTATTDLAFLWVGFLPAGTPAAARTLLNKWDTGGGGKGYHIRCDPSVGFTFFTRTSGNTANAGSSGLFLGEWHVGLAVIDRSTGKMRIGTRGLTSGTSVVTAEASITANDETNAFQFQVGSGAGLGATPMNIAALYVAYGVGACSGLSANLSTALSNFAATFAQTQTGTEAAKGCWIPLSNIDCNNGRGNPLSAPKRDDGNAILGPGGFVYGVHSKFQFRHPNIAFRMCPVNRVWSAHATVVNEDYETWYLETQRGQHAWFSSYSPVKVYWDNAGVPTQLGNGVVSSWKMAKPKTLDDLRNSVENYIGLSDVELGDLWSVAS